MALFAGLACKWDTTNKKNTWNRPYAGTLRINSSGYIYNHGYGGATFLFMDGSARLIIARDASKGGYYSYFTEPIPGIGNLVNP